MRRGPSAPSQGGTDPSEKIDAERRAQRDPLRDIFRRFRAVPLDPAWVKGGAAALARRLVADGSFDAPPILADASCADAGLLAHLRGGGPHARGCRALDVVRGLSAAASTAPQPPPPPLGGEHKVTSGVPALA